MRNKSGKFIIGLIISLAILAFYLPGIPIVKADTGTPVIESVEPDRGFDSGGMELTITGTNLQDVSEIYFGMFPQEILEQAEDGTNIKVKTSAYWASGRQEIYLDNDSSGFEFTFISSPDIEGLLNSQDTVLQYISTGGGETIKINGSGFEEGAQIFFNPVLTRASLGGDDCVYLASNQESDISECTYQLSSGSEATGVQYIDSETIVLSSPAVQQAGAGTILLVNPDGGAASFNVEYQKNESVSSQLTIDSISPEQGTVLGGTELKIEGSHFQSGLSLFIGEQELSYYLFSMVDSKTIYLTLPSSQEAGEVNIRLLNPDGQESNLFSFTYISNPGISSLLEPSSANSIWELPFEGGQEIKIRGNSFMEGIRIVFSPEVKKADENESSQGELIYLNGEEYFLISGTEVQDIRLVDDKNLYVTTPASEEDSSGLMVINADGGASSIYTSFYYDEAMPRIDSISPEQGSVLGNTELKIDGANFQIGLSIYIGNQLLSTSQFSRVDSKTIYLTTPASTQAGEVEIKIVNPDGKQSNLQEYLYISNPLINLLTDPPTGVSLEELLPGGGQEIKISGSSFMEDIRVIFNPVIEKYSEDEQAEGELIYINGEKYILKSGTEGQQLRLIDDNTLYVTTPAAVLKSSTLIVINSDGGASPEYYIDYNYPELDTTTTITAEIVEDKKSEDVFIKVNWDSVDNAVEYEVFVSVDGDDPEYLGATQRTSYIYYDIEDDTEYEFLIKAMGEYSFSPLSEESKRVETDDIATDDEGINEYTESFRSGDSALIKVGTRDFDDDGTIKIDMSRGELAGSREAVIIMPAKVVASSRAEDVEITALDWILRFNPNAFMLDSLYQNRKEADSGIRFRIRPYTGELQRGVRSLSGTYILEAWIYNGKDFIEMDYLAENIFFNLDYDYNKARMRRLQNPAMYRYNQYSQEWESSYYWQNREDGGVMPINRLGIYTIMGNRTH